ncbi:bifunctional D-glycero-beta-D-manno-heptose-7-phosphate kinase/D-glycero-beta-D-manno-heptose 1-phosphate adenylyltransferase HldE [Caedibacter taeniospiralis]|jgi:D-beta-D-heptose 7-phosphate kinase/D-beta-D-heptose 1-phosphate adenosyltransferase|uniref:bifunctional D-glycero-beta-D-manno-heptose-7-phosphate kinase/D-glycero-beta-D-manno-heptose 1-phosphate adenylyltransferase HldE n=1 Tax=Caedibacter taeniospiralis TaxID=28907 RepID=UPI0037BF0DDE
MQSNLQKARVLVVGDLMLDRYYYGATERISPEAPVPVVHVKTIQDRAGGAGNVALNIASLEGKAGICAMVGQDEPARILEKFFAEQSIQAHLMGTHLPTITKLRVLSQKQQLLRLDFEEGFSQIDGALLTKNISKVIGQYNVMILSDYGKGTLQDAKSLIALAKSRDIAVLVDPKGNDFSIYQGASLITPNRKEFEAVVGKCHDEKELVEKARGLISACQLGGLLITRSEEGMTLVLNTGELTTIPTVAKEVFDVTGAGDTVIAVMAMAISCGYDLISAMRLANAAAGVVVGKVGTATLNAQELHDALHAQIRVDKGILSESELKKAMNEVRLQGEKVVMTNGCFDILHAGHVEYLQKARALGDRLIVAVNTDESVKRIKGNTRPYVGLQSRMEVLAALSCVDWVVAFDEDTPKRIISEILPDILVKGADYEIDQIAGSKEVIAAGGEVKTITLKPDHSSTSIIEKIKTTIN